VTDIVERLRYTATCGVPDFTNSKLLDEAADEIERLEALLRGVGANRYWEGRWRDEKTENERLLAALKAIIKSYDDLNVPTIEVIENARPLVDPVQ
jgi:hypothetical protein